MYVVHLNTDIFYPTYGTVVREWANPNPTWEAQIKRVTLWGGITIGANMDFSCALYLEGDEHTLASNTPGMTWPGHMPLAVMSLDRYGNSDGQEYQRDIDLTPYNLILHPGKKLILHGNCVNHGPNTVFGWAGANDNAHAQAYVWLD